MSPGRPEPSVSFNKSIIGTTSPTIYGYLFRWNTTTILSSTYALQTLATDGAGNTAYSAGITIKVKN